MCLLDVNVHVNYYFTTHKEIKKNIFIKKMFHFGHKETVRERQQQQSRHLIEPGHFGRQHV